MAKSRNSHLTLAPASADAAPDSAEVVRLPVPGSDAVLVDAILAGDSRAAAGIFERYAAHVRRILVRVLGPDSEIDDLIQEVFLAALEGMHRLGDPKMLRGFLTSIAVFTARGCIRKRRRWRPFLQFVAEPPETTTPRSSPEATQALRSAYRVLDELPADDRIAFALRFIEGMELKEVAIAVDVSLATAKRRVARASAAFTERARREPALVPWIEEGGRWTT